MRRSHAVAVLAVGVAVLIVPVVAHGVCPAVPNGTFTSDISGWSNYATFNGSIGNPVGSDQVGPVTGTGGGTTCGNSLSNCLPVSAGDSCTLSAQAFVPNGQPTSGFGELSFVFYSDPACSSFLSFSTMPQIQGTTQGTWTSLTTGPVTIPVGAQSARISLNVCATGTTSMTIDWDNVVSEAPASAIPTLGWTALAALGALLALAGVLVLRGVRS